MKSKRLEATVIVAVASALAVLPILLTPKDLTKSNTIIAEKAKSSKLLFAKLQ